MCCKRYHIIFSTMSLKFKCKISLPKEVIRNFKKSHFVHVTSYELTHFKKVVRVWKTKSLLFCLRYDPLIVFWRQNHITFIFIKMMSHDLFVQMAYLKGYSYLMLYWKKQSQQKPTANIGSTTRRTTVFNNQPTISLKFVLLLL